MAVLIAKPVAEVCLPATRNTAEDNFHACGRRLTRKRSATAGGSERELEWTCFSHGKRDRTRASGWLHRLVRCLAWLHNHFCRTARRLFTVRTMPITIKITLGQNVKNARMPKPTGFGLGSRVRPSCAARITTSSG